MDISSTLTAAYVARTPTGSSTDRAPTLPASVSDGPDKENDNDRDDGGSVTATRGQLVNITA